MPEKFKPYNLDQAQPADAKALAGKDEAAKMSASAEAPADKEAKIGSGEAKDCKEVEKKVEQEKKSDLGKLKNSKTFDLLKLDYENYRSILAKKLFETKDSKLRQRILKKTKKVKEEAEVTDYDIFRRYHNIERRFILDIKKTSKEDAEIDNIESLKKTKQYLMHLLNIVHGDQKKADKSEMSNYGELLDNLDEIRKKHPALYSAFVENKIDIADFRHTAFENDREIKSKLKEEKNSDNEKINKILNMHYWGPLFVCSASAMSHLVPSWEKGSQKSPAIFFDNKKVLEKVFEKYNVGEISGYFDKEVKATKKVLAQMRVGFEGLPATQPFWNPVHADKNENNRFYAPRSWKFLFNGHVLMELQALLGTVPMRLHDNQDSKFEENFSEERFDELLKEMTDKKMGLDEMQEQIDKEFMYRVDENTTISPLIIDNSFIRAIYLNGKIYNNKGEVIIDQKEKTPTQEKT